MKRKLIATLALTLGVSVLSSCAGVISFPERATDPGVSLWQEPETEAPSDPGKLLGIWHSKGGNTVFRFGEGGVLTVWGLTAGYDYEYSSTATGSYTYDGKTLTMTLGEEHVTRECRVKDGVISFTDGDVTLSLQTEEPKPHPSYPYPDFEALAAKTGLLGAAGLTGQTVPAAGKRLQAKLKMKETYFSGKTMEKLTEGTARQGDIVNIDYVGKRDGVAFEGGTAKGQDVSVAPDTGYIPGFCEGIAGHSVGETFDVTVTFPEGYKNRDLAGKEAVFTMTLNAIYDTNITDEMVAAFDGNTHTTVAEWEAEIYRDLIKDSIWDILPAFAEVTDGSDAYLYYYQDMLDYYHYYAAYYGMDFEMFLSLYVGKTEAELETESRGYVRNYLLAAMVARALELTPDAKWLEDFTAGYLAAYVKKGYTEEQARELIETDGDEKNRFRAAMLLDLTADHLFANNTFTEE